MEFCNMEMRKIDIAVISDVHLGTYGCHATELLNYLNSIDPATLVLNGDIIDIWQFSKRYWPASHMEVVNKIIKMAAAGVKVYYLTGNHDEMLRKFSDVSIGNIHIADKLVLTVQDKKIWFFHGDVFDVTMKHSKWLAKLGGKGYDLLILLNRFINYCLEKMGREKFSFSKRIKQSVKQAIRFIADFEQIAGDIAIDNGYDYVVCGHIHQPVIKEYWNNEGSVIYMNSGDWVESLTSLECRRGNWELVQYSEAPMVLKAI